MTEVTAVLKEASPFGASYSGFIYNDVRGRWKDGTEVITSKVEKVEGDLLYTLNSVYRLE